MKRMIRVTISFICVMLYIILMALPVYAMDEPDSDPSFSNIKANVNLIEEGDVLIYGLYDIPYETIPDNDASETYILRLIDTDGTTQLGAVRVYPYSEFDNGYNDGAFSFYFAASDNLTINQQYTLRISQSPSYFATPRSWEYTMPDTAWTSSTEQTDNQAELAINIATLASKLETKYDVTLLEDSPGGTILSSPEGATYFRGAIYGLQLMCPDMFMMQVLAFDTNARSWTTAHFDDYSTQFDDTFIGDAEDALATASDIPIDMLMFIIAGIPIIGGAIWLSKVKFGAVEPGYVIIPLMLILFVSMGWMEVALFALCNQIFIMFIGYVWFYKSSSDVSGKGLSFVAFTWVMSTILCLVLEGSWLGTTENTVINDLTAFNFQSVANIATMPVSALYFFRGIFRMLLWDYSFYTGDYTFLRYLWLAVFNSPIVYMFSRDFVHVTANVLSFLRR